MQRIVEAMADTPAFVTNSRGDILAINRLGRALFAPMYATDARPVNAARFLFLDPASRDFWPDWDSIANDTVATLRTAAGRDPYDRDLSDLIGELSTRSDEFRIRWGAHNVRLHRTGTKRLHHPDVGELTLAFEVLALAADQDQQLVAYTAEPGTPSHDSLHLLASLIATSVDRDTPAIDVRDHDPPSTQDRDH